MSRACAAACLALLAGGLGCSKSSRPWIDRIEVDAFEGGDVISLSRDQLALRLVTRLEAARFVVAKPGQRVPDDVKPWRLQLAAGLQEPDLEKLTSSVQLVLELQHTGEGEPFSLDVVRPVRPPSSPDVEGVQASIRDGFDDALSEAVQEAAAIITQEGASDDALVKQLQDPNPALSGAAARLLVRRHHEAALPPLLARLKTDDLHALRAVMGLLVELRSPGAVNPLIEAATRKGPSFEREVVFAIGAIGGDDAEAYLDLVASGHDEPLVRASAEQALQELRARKRVRAPPGETR